MSRERQIYWTQGRKGPGSVCAGARAAACFMGNSEEELG